MEGARQDLRDAGRVVDLRHPLGDAAEDRAVVHLLEGAAAPHGAPDLADEEDQRHGIMFGDMQARSRIGGTGTARHHADAGAVGQPGAGIRHHGGAGLVAADGERDGGVVERVEHREIALARHAEDMVDALRHEPVDEDLSARPPVVVWSSHHLPVPTVSPLVPPQAGSARISASCCPRLGAGRVLAAGTPSITIAERTPGVVPPAASGLDSDSLRPRAAT